MKLVIAVIQPTKLKPVREALEKIEVTRMTICDAQGFAKQRSYGGIDGEDQREASYFRRVALEIVVNDDFLERTIDTIAGVARTGPAGTLGDGKIFVVPVGDAIQIDDGFHGPGAV